MQDVVKTICRDTYNRIYNSEKERRYNEAVASLRGETVSEKKKDEIEKATQKEAIKQTIIETMKRFPQEESAELWKAIYEVHIHRKSGIDDAETVAKVVSADQSWKKSSGHAFEETIKYLASEALAGTCIEIVLQKDLNKMIRTGEIANEPRDISWLKEQIRGNVFDLYATVTREDGRKFCFGCIQSKTSVRDRVTRDREPSLQAMASYFWSTIVVLDGDFLRLPKFISMVNGETTEYPTNGWHGMYVLSRQYCDGRIYPTDSSLGIFREHAVQAAKYWLTQRQWFDHSWNAAEGSRPLEPKR